MLDDENDVLEFPEDTDEVEELDPEEVFEEVDAEEKADDKASDDAAKIRELEDRLSEQGLTLLLKGKASDYMIEHGYDPSMGARPMRRLIQREIEDPLAALLLSGKRGDSNQVVINCDGEKLSVRFKATRPRIEFAYPSTDSEKEPIIR